MSELGDSSGMHARRQLGYGIILVLASVLITFLVHAYVAYSPGDTGMPRTSSNLVRLWAIPFCWWIASLIAFATSYRLYRGAQPTLALRYSAMIWLVLSALANCLVAAAMRQLGAL